MCAFDRTLAFTPEHPLGTNCSVPPVCEHVTTYMCLSLVYSIFRRSWKLLLLVQQSCELHSELPTCAAIVEEEIHE